MTSPTHYMQQAIHQAKQGIHHTNPNPNVGCLIVKNDHIISRGFHPKAGLGHAEVYALKEAGSAAQGATAYVTLEPCSHFGRTPPCASALIKAGIAKVYIGMTDPNPQVSGNGIKMLEDAGIEVEIMPADINEQCQALNQGFIKRMTQNLPFVRLKSAISLDGRTAMRSGDSVWITGKESRADVQRLRALSCVVITGVDSVNIDNPMMNVRDEQYKDIDGQIRQPLRVIIDSQLRIDLNSKILTSATEQAPVMVVYSEAHHENKAVLSALNEKGVQTLALPLNGKHIDLNALLAFLGKSYNDVLVESGAQLSAAFIEQALVDELVVYQAPVIMGNSARAMFDLNILKMKHVQRLNCTDKQDFGKDVRYTFDLNAQETAQCSQD